MHRFLLAGFVTIAYAASLLAQQAAPAGTLVRAEAQPRTLPGTPQSVFAVIQGSAISAANTMIAGGIVRLRDIKFGRITDVQTTDAAGHFAFTSVDPGSYVVELLGKDEKVLAASDIVTVEAGRNRSTIVRVPSNVPPSGFFSGGVPVAVAVAADAAAAGVLAVTPGSAPDMSPR